MIDNLLGICSAGVLYIYSVLLSETALLLTKGFVDSQIEKYRSITFGKENAYKAHTHHQLEHDEDEIALNHSCENVDSFSDIE